MSRKQILILGGILMAVTFIIEALFVHPEHVEYFWEAVPGYDVIFGFLGCILIILFSKKLISLWVSRDEDYYGGEK